MISYLWLNTYASCHWFGCIRGFPFPYESWSDAVFSTQVGVLMLVANAVAWLGVLMTVLQYWPRRQRSWGQAVTLISFAAAYLLLNSQISFGVKYMFSLAWQKNDGAQLGYGFPFIYIAPEKGAWPWHFVVDLAIGVVLLAAVEWEYERITHKLANPPLRPTA